MLKLQVEKERLYYLSRVDKKNSIVTVSIFHAYAPNIQSAHQSSPKFASKTMIALNIITNCFLDFEASPLTSFEIRLHKRHCPATSNGKKTYIYDFSVLTSLYPDTFSILRSIEMQLN